MSSNAHHIFPEDFIDKLWVIVDKLFEFDLLRLSKCCASCALIAGWIFFYDFLEVPCDNPLNYLQLKGIEPYQSNNCMNNR